MQKMKMESYVLRSSILFLSLLLSLQTVAAQELYFDSDIISLGEVSGFKRTELKIPFSNVGDKSVFISACLSSSDKVTCTIENNMVSARAASQLFLSIEPDLPGTDFMFNVIIKNNSFQPRKTIRFYGNFGTSIEPEQSDFISENVSISIDSGFEADVTAFVCCLNSSDCHGQSIDAGSVESLVSSKLLSSFRLLERSSLDKVLEEAKLNMSGLVDEQSVLDVGNLSGANSIILVNSTCLDNEVLHTIRVVSCSSGAQLMAASGLGVKLSDLLNRVSHELASYR